MRTLVPAPPARTKQPAAAPRDGAVQRAEAPAPNRTGLPDDLKSGIETLSGVSMDAVRVHYDSALPAPLAARAYAQGTDIHLAPGQERSLPHEAWHVVQQAQGRVRPTLQLSGGVAINDDASLEREADRLGALAASGWSMPARWPAGLVARPSMVVQGNFKTEEEAIAYFENVLLPQVDKQENVDQGPASSKAEKQGSEDEPTLVDLQEIASAREWKILQARIDLGLASRRRKLTTLPLIETFRAMLEVAGKPYKEGYDDTVRGAHTPGKDLARHQVDYQALLTDELGLHPDVIMSFHRSAGFEYEFANFFDTKRRKETERLDMEILPSHVLLAHSAISGSVFKRRFNLETDAQNAIEMVTPPFVLLIANDTYDIIKRIDKENRESLQGLAQQISEPPAQANTNMKWDADEEKLLYLPTQAEEIKSLDEHLSKFEQSGFGAGWQWQYNAAQHRGPEKLSATRVGAKHASNILGQVNLSMTPQEVMAVTSLAIENNSKDGAYPAFKLIYDIVKDTNLSALDGVLGFYARSMSSIIGIPSILYRRELEARPEGGNLATTIKETLGLWVKDFPYLVIADYLATLSPKMRTDFIEKVRATEPRVADVISKEVKQNIEILKGVYIEMIKRDSLQQKDRKNAESTREFQNKLNDIKEKMKDEPHEKISLAIKKTTADSTKPMLEKKRIVESEYKQMLESAPALFDVRQEQWKKIVVAETTAAIAHIVNEISAATRPDIPQRGTPEKFETGEGVRKETFLGSLPGLRRLRVAEVRSTYEVDKIEERLMKTYSS